MKKIISSLMKKKVKDLIKILGIGLNELVIDINLDEVTFNSIEWDEENNKIILHKFEDDLDYEFDFEELTDDQQMMVYKILSVIYN
jgi:hypothetical protein